MKKQQVILSLILVPASAMIALLANRIMQLETKLQVSSQIATQVQPTSFVGSNQGDLQQTVQGQNTPKYENRLKYGQFIQMLKNGKIESVGLSTDRAKALVQLLDGSKAIVNTPPNDSQLVNLLIENVKFNMYVLPANDNPSRSGHNSTPNTWTYGELIQQVKSGRVAKVIVTVTRSEALVQTVNGTKRTTLLDSNEELFNLLTSKGIEYNFQK